MSTPIDVKMCLSKRRWGRRERAERAAAKANRPVKPYRCPLCAGWHLTSRVRQAQQFEVDDDI